MSQKDKHNDEYALKQLASKKWAKPRVEFSRRDMALRTKMIRDKILKMTIESYEKSTKASSEQFRTKTLMRTKNVPHNYYTITNSLGKYLVKDGDIKANKYISYIPVVLNNCLNRTIIFAFGKIVDLTSLTKEEILEAERNLGIGKR